MSDLTVPITGALVKVDLPNAQLAASIAAQIAGRAGLASPAFTGTPTAPTAAPGTNTTQIANTAFVQAAVAALLNGAPGALDTLKELADAINDDASFAATITTALAGKQPLHATLTALAGLTLAQGDILYRDASGLQKLAAGTAGKRLKTGGAGANPSWAWPDVQVLAQGGAKISFTGDTTAHNFVDLTIPGGTMGANDRLRVSGMFSYTSSANIKTLNVKLGATTFRNFTPTTTTEIDFQASIAARNASNSQVGGGSGQVLINQAASVSAITGANDMTADQHLIISGQNSNAGETVSLEWYCIELLRAPV